MKTQLARSRYPGLVLIFLLGACSGGNIDVSVEGPIVPNFPPVPTSEAITAHGIITGLGDLTVNDVVYAANAATVTINGQPGNLSDLELGQIVTVNGRINALGRTGTAHHIRFDANLLGPVENVDAQSDRLIVMGQSVITDLDTRFGAGIDRDTFRGLSVGSIVQVSGYEDAAGAIRATRIDIAPANAESHVVGRVAGLDIANMLFTINRLTVDYSNAVLIDLPGGAPAEGLKVRVFGSVAGGLFIVERLVSAPTLDLNAGHSNLKHRNPWIKPTNGLSRASVIIISGNTASLPVII